MKTRNFDFNSIISPDTDRFSVSDLARILLEQQYVDKVLVEELRTWLYQGGRFFHTKGEFIKKSSFFKDSRFLICPTELELQSSYLIPGHRWLPFVERSLKPWDITLLDKQGNEVCKVDKRQDIQALKAFHLLLGEQRLFSDQQLKSNLLGEFVAEFPHYSLKDLLGGSEMKKNQCLLCRVLDYQKGVIQVEAVVEEEGNGLWHEDLENAILKVIDQFGLSLNLPEQLEWAIYMGHPRLRTQPLQSLATFINTHPQFSLYKVGISTVLWKSDGSIEEHIMTDPYYRNPEVLLKEGQKVLKEMKGLFEQMSPFTEEAIGAIKKWGLLYMEHYQTCLQRMSLAPSSFMSREQQLFISISQYSHCLAESIKGMIQVPPSREEREDAIALIMETENLLNQVMPFMMDCTNPFLQT